MIPYLYTMNVKTHEEGAPLISPMYYFYPENDESYNVPNQYFWNRTNGGSHCRKRWTWHSNLQKWMYGSLKVNGMTSFQRKNIQVV